MADLTVAGTGWDWVGDRWVQVAGPTDYPAAHLGALLGAFCGRFEYETAPGYDPDPPQAHAERAAAWLRDHGWPDAVARPVRDPDDNLPPDTVYGSGAPTTP